MKLLAFLALVFLTASSLAAEPGDEKWQAQNVEVTIPAVIVAGTEFPVIYRSKPRDAISLKATFVTKSKEGVLGQGRVTDTPLSASHRIRKAVIDEPGTYLVTFEFKNRGGKILNATARTKVRAATEFDALFTGKVWELPHKNLYFAPQNAPSWEQAPPDKREILALERVNFRPLLEQPDYNSNWWPMRGWNELHEILRPEWVPPLALMHAFENSSYYPPTHVVYAAWSQNGLNLIYPAEVDGPAWFHLESPATADKIAVNSIFQTAFLDSTGSDVTARSMLARWMIRHRALKSDTPLEAVNIQLVQLRRTAELNLRFPGYSAPGKPRF